jgi:hypothetical protein
MRVVISQPMFFPWVGLFEQVRLADAYVHYDDVQFSKGSFVNRVQIKTARGSEWLTVPTASRRLGQEIRDVAINETDDWRAQHLAFLERSFHGAPFAADALRLAADVYARRATNMGDLTMASMEAVCAYFDFAPPSGFVKSSTLGIGGRSWERVLSIVKHFGGDVYITGHGAREYLDHDAFEAARVRVEYMQYERVPYPQLFGEFTPYVSVLDLIANRGVDGLAVIRSGTLPWREFVARG